MTDAGSIWLADTNDERRVVLVLSSARFNRISGRVLVAPEQPAEPVVFPWRIDADGRTFAVDLLQSIAADRLLDCVGVVSPPQLSAARQALRLIV